MVAVTSVRPGEHVPTADQRIVMHGVPWSHFEVLLALRGDEPAPRMAYLEGTLELMNPSRTHEQVKSFLGRLLEAYLLELGIEFVPYGSWTLRSAPKARGIEPDDCYILGEDQNKDVPDLAIEVIWTSGGIDKLAIYAGLGVREVWVWEDDIVRVHVLAGAVYAERPRSELLPDVDVALIASLLDRPTTSQAIRALRAALAKRSP